MRATIFILALVVFGVSVSVTNMIARSPVSIDKSSAPKPQQPVTLCAKDERVIFSCPVKKPARIVSVCASKDLTSERGYLQYRFGLPGKIELEFPKDRKGTQEKFHYTHYFRAQFDMTSINFTIRASASRRRANRRRSASSAARNQRLTTLICRLCFRAGNNNSEHVGYRLRDRTYITAFKRILAEVKPKMDPTVLAAAAGVIGAVIGAVLGGVFALKATKRQVEVMLLQSRGDVNERLIVKASR